nr:MAG TPA: Gifsy-2 prophage ATP-binding sugar transporter-like barrel, 4 helix bundle.7A [Caudoviricetes sp.]
MNPDEFGEIHKIGQRLMTVIIDESEIFERSKKQAERGRIDGIYERQILLYVSRSEFGKLPGVGSVLQVDNTNYRIVDAVDEGGIYSITLGYLSS